MMEDLESDVRELDMLVQVEDVVDRMFQEQAPALVHQSFGERMAFRPGELTIWAGMGGSGKSQLVGQVIAWALAQGETATIASLEMPMEATLRRMLTQILDAPPTMGSAKAWAEAMRGRLYLYDQIDRVPADRMLSMVRVAAQMLECGHIVIDSLTKCGLPQDGDGYLTKQTDFVDRLQHAVKHLGCHCHLVVHLRKGEGGQRRGMHDIRGASQISDLADNVLILSRDVEKERVMEEASLKPESQWTDKFAKLVDMARDRPDAVLQVEKQRATGWLGDIKLDFHQRSGQFIPHGRVQAMPWKLASPQNDTDRQTAVTPSRRGHYGSAEVETWD
jgi:twinkle protein